MIRCILIPDIHLKHERVQSILAQETYDKVIFTADYFDSFDDTAEQNRQTALWLKESLKDPRHIHLLGNHDCGYRFAYVRAAYCSGYTDEKAYAINQVLTEEDWEKVKYYHVEAGILFTHAGLSTTFLNEAKAPKTMPEVVEWLDWSLKYDVATMKGYPDRAPKLFGAGWSRGGRERVGGLTWCDFSELIPTAFPQLVGHSTHPNPDFVFRVPNTSKLIRLSVEDEIDPVLFKTHWWALDLDTGLNHYAVLEHEGERKTLIIKKLYWANDTIVDPYKGFIEIREKLLDSVEIGRFDISQ